MKEKAPMMLRGLIGDFLRRGELGKHFAEEQIKEEWKSLGGGNIARYTTFVNVKDRKLLVKLTAAPLKNDLMMQRADLVKRLNEKVGVDVIEDIIFL